MQITPEGKTMFTSKGELYYHLLLEMGLGIDKAQHIYDQTTGDTLSWKDKYIKVDVNDQPIYAGKDEVIFSIDENFNLMMNMFAHFLDTVANDDDINISVVAHFVEHMDTPDGLLKSRLNIKYNTKDGALTNQIMVTSWFSDPWLCYLEAIFLLNGNAGFDLSNFDQERERR